uniref:Uncharacterized protein n=1 Tax=Romanomermis culicivorax TaxID=13658 RepID=A0A915L3I4_ROMCU
CHSGFDDSVVGFAAAAAEIREAGQCKPVNDTENDWRRQHSSSITDAMWAVWSTDLAKKYLHLPWALLNEPSEVEALTAADVVLLAPAALRILGPDIARRALKFITDGTICATLVD